MWRPNPRQNRESERSTSQNIFFQKRKRKRFFEEKFDTTPQMWYNNYITAVEKASES